MKRALPTIIARFFPVFENEEILMEPLVVQENELSVEPRHKLSVEMIIKCRHNYKSKTGYFRQALLTS